MTNKLILRIVTCVFYLAIAIAQEVPEAPSFIHPVIDSVGVLSQHEKDQLYQKLKDYSDSTSTEILVVIVNTTYENNINLYAAELGHKWQIGQAGKDNGVVILAAIEDREVAIQVGYGVEHLLTDALSKRIIENMIIPEFKKADYYNGLDKATSAIISILSGEYQTEEKESSGFPFGLILFIILIIIVLIAANNKKNRGSGISKGGGDGDLLREIFRGIVLSNQGKGKFGSGGSFGGRSSGGFGGFGGGGSFGGGGASGSW